MMVPAISRFDVCYQELLYSASCENVHDIDKPLKIVRDSKRCFVYLRKGHQANNCSGGKKCRRCDGRHCQSICRGTSNDSENSQKKAQACRDSNCKGND